jgi:hypothetical protein
MNQGHRTESKITKNRKEKKTGSRTRKFTRDSGKEETWN